MLSVSSLTSSTLADLQIQGQILPAPVLQYGQRTVTTDRRPGSWEPGRYSVPGKMPSYAIASFADRRGTENAMNVSRHLLVYPVNALFRQRFSFCLIDVL